MLLRISAGRHFFVAFGQAEEKQNVYFLLERTDLEYEKSAFNDNEIKVFIFLSNINFRIPLIRDYYVILF